MNVLNDAEKILKDLRMQLESDAEAGYHVFICGNKGRKPEDKWRRLSMNKVLADELGEGVIAKVGEINTNLKDYPLVEFDFDEMSSNSVGVTKIGGLPHFEEWASDMPEVDWPHLLKDKDPVLKAMKFYVIKVEVEGGLTAYFYRGKRGFQNLLGRKGRVAAMFSADADELKSIDGTVLTFDNNFDFFSVNGNIFVLNLGTFESLTNLREVTVSKAKEAVDKINLRFRVANSDEIVSKMSSRIALAKRLAAAAHYGVIEKQDGEALIGRIKEKKLSISLDKKGDDFVFDVDPEDNSQVAEFVNLMVDFYLRSSTSDIEWEVQVKKPAN